MTRKKEKTICAIIMAGGPGERFWPLSTPEEPKQFLKIFGRRSLLRETVSRLRGLVPAERTFVVTSAALAKRTRSELPELPARNVVGEPCRRDTAAAMAAACGIVLRTCGPDGTGIVLSSDHAIADAVGFRRALRACARASAGSDGIFTIGVKPDRPATGYGYIELESADAALSKTPVPAKRFAEKPDAVTAARWVKSGRFLWNSGTFVWRAGALARIFESVAPQWSALVEDVAGGGNAERAMKRIYPDLPKVSFDYAVMEKTAGVRTMPADVGWDDVGTWLAMERAFPADADGNVIRGKAAQHGCRNCIIVSGGPQIGALGLDGFVVAAAQGGTFVAPKSALGDMKKLVAKLGSAGTGGHGKI